MIRCNFNYVKEFININRYRNILEEKEKIYKKLDNEYMTGWRKPISLETINKIINVTEKVKQNSDCLVVIGIGGSFLGSYAVNKMLSSYFKKDNFEVIYAGTTLSSEYMNELLKYLETKNFSINVISKSGTTMETTITYNILKEMLYKKYDKETVKNKIIITTDETKGALREEANTYGYESFIIPDDIGGRYSIMTPAHLFPLAFNINIKSLIEGYYEGEEYKDLAYKYATIRKCLNENGKMIENYVVYEEKYLYFTEWLKQLFAESEGKEGKGIFPVSTLHTRDLHSLGQFIQEGPKIMFETFIKVEKTEDFIYSNKSLHEINNIVEDSVRKAHYSGNVATIELLVPQINEKILGSLMYFFMLSAAFSSYLFDVNPFNQPGVEVYKKEIKKNLGEL